MPPKRTLHELEDLAAAQGYPSYKDMLHELYVVRQMGLHDIAAMCHVYWKRTRRHLLRFGIPIKGRGGNTGRHRTKVTVTPELVNEIIRDGIPAVSQRVGISDPRLRQLLKAFVQGQRNGTR